MHIAEFSAEPLPEPMLYQRVGEGHFASARLNAETTHLATFGLYTCKAVGLYDAESQSGLLAHIDGTAQPERIIDRIAEKYPKNITESEVSIVQAVQDELEFLWPSVDTLANIIKKYSPRKLRIDRNGSDVSPRHIALCLRTGQMYEATNKDEIEIQSASNLKPSEPLRSSDFHL